MAFTPQEIEAANRLGINITNVISQPGVPRYTSYIPSQPWEGTVPDAIQQYRTQDFHRGLIRGRRTAGDHHIWQLLTPATHYHTSPQSALDTFRKARKAISRGHAAYLDTEILGGLDKDFFSMTEIAIQHRDQTFRRMIQPTTAVESRLRSLITQLESPHSAVALRDHEWRSLRDLMKYADISVGDQQALREVSNIRPGTSLAGHTQAIKRGLDNLMRFGSDPSQAARDLNDYVSRLTQQRATFITFGGATSDYPWLNAFLAQHGASPLSSSKHMDARQVIESLGLAGEIDVPGMTRQKSLEAIAKRWGIRRTDYIQPHTAFGDIELLRDLVEGMPARGQAAEVQGLIPRGRRRLMEMTYEARNLFRGHTMDSAGLTQIGTGMAYSPRPLKIGDDLFTVAGMKQGFEDVERGMYDMIFERAHRGARWEAIDWMDTTLYRNVRYQFAGIRPETIAGQQYYSMFLEAPDLGAMSKITRGSLEELQNIVHQRTVPYRVAEHLGYDALIPRDLAAGRDITRRQLETAQRTYRRMLDPGRGPNSGYRLAQRLYSAAQDYGSTGRMPGFLRPAERTTIEVMHRRLMQESAFTLPVLEQIAGRHLDLPGGAMTIFEQDLAFGRALRGLGEHRMELPTLPWERQVDVLSDYGRLTTPRAAAGAVTTRGRYTAVNLADPDAAMRTIMGTIRGHQLAGTIDEERVALTGIRRIVYDLQQRGILDDVQARRVIGTPEGVAPGRVASRQAEILVRALRNLSPEHPGMIDAVPFEHIGTRVGEQARQIPTSPQQINEITSNVIDEVMFRRSSMTNRIFGRQLTEGIDHDNLMRTFFDGVGRVTPSGTPIGYEESLRNIVRQFEGKGLKTAVVPMLDPNTGNMVSMQLQVYPERLARQAVRAAYLAPGEIIPGVATVDLPMVTPQGRIQHGGLSRIPVPRLHESDPRRVVSVMEDISERAFSPGKLNAFAEFMSRGQFIEAQALLKRSMTKEIQKLPGLGRAYVEAGQIDTTRWVTSHPVVADELKANLVSAEAYIDRQLQAKHKDPRFIPMTDRYRNLVDQYTELIRPGTGYYMAGKDDEVTRAFLSKVDIHTLHPFGPMLSPGREAVRQYFGHYRLGDPEQLTRQIDVAGLSAGVTTRKMLTTTALEDVTQRISGGTPYQMGLRMKTAYMTDTDLHRAIESALARTDLSPAVRQELTHMRYVASTYEGMLPIAREALSLFEATYEKTMTLDAEQARRVGEAISEGRLSRRLLPFQEIIPDLRWQDIGMGEIIGIEELEGGRARLRVRSTVDAEGTVKLVYAGGEKGTTVPFSRQAIEAVTPEGTVAIARPDFTKHTTPGMWIEGQIGKALHALRHRPDEAQSLVNEINRIAGEQRLLTAARVDQSFAVSDSVVQGLGKQRAQDIMAAINRRVPLMEPIYDKQQVVTAMPEWIRMRVGDPLFYSDIRGQMRLGDEVITGRGAQLGFRELQSLRGREGDLSQAIRYFEDAIQTLPAHQPYHRAQAGTFRAAQALFDPQILDEITDVRYMTGEGALATLTRPIERGRYLDIRGTALQPTGTDVGDIYRLGLPEGITRADVKTRLGQLKPTDRQYGALEVLHKYMPDRIESVPMAVQVHPQTYISSVGSAQAQLARDVGYMHTAISDVDRYLSPARPGVTQATAVQQAKHDVIDRMAGYYEEMNVQLTAAKGEAFTRAMHGRLNMSARLTLQGVSPQRMADLQRMGIGEHTAFISERFARDILGDDYTRYFGALDEQGIARVGKERLTGLGVRYPTIGIGSVAPLEFRVASWAQPDTIYTTPGTTKMWHGDFDDDKLAVFMAHARGKVAPHARAARENIASWIDRHKFTGDAAQAGRTIIEQERNLIGMLAPGQVLSPAQQEMYGPMRELADTRLLTDPDIRGAMQLHGTRVKATKALIGPTSVMGSMLRNIAEPIYGAGSAEYLRIARLTEAFEQGAFQIQHGVGDIRPDMSSADIAAQIRRAEPPALRILDTMKGVMGGKLLPEHVQQIESLNIKGLTSQELRESLQQVEELASMRIGRGFKQTQIQALLQKADYLDKESLALLAGSPQMTGQERIMNTENISRLLRQLGDPGIARAEEIRLRDPLMRAMDQAAYTKQITELSKAPPPPGVMARMGLPDVKFTPKMGMWAVGIAAGIYAFQRVRGAATMMDRPRHPQADVAPEPDGEYPSFMMDQEGPSSPIGRIYERGYGYDGLQVKIRGTRRGSTLDNEYVAQSISDAMQAQLPVPMEVKIHSQDNRSRMDRRQVQDIVSQAIKGNW